MSIQVYDKNGQPYEADLVDGEQYRQLERENTALRAEIDSLKSALEALAVSSMNREDPL